MLPATPTQRSETESDAPPRSRSARLRDRCEAEERRLLLKEDMYEDELPYEESDLSSRDLSDVTPRKEGGLLSGGRMLGELYMHASEVDASTEGGRSDGDLSLIHI